MRRVRPLVHTHNISPPETLKLIQKVIQSETVGVGYAASSFYPVFLAPEPLAVHRSVSDHQLGFAERRRRHEPGPPKRV
jgi:hypothetical protein